MTLTSALRQSGRSVFTDRVSDSEVFPGVGQTTGFLEMREDSGAR